MAREPVYLDYHATTPVDPRVLEVMLPYLTTDFGNPASASHQWGWRSQEAVEQARRQVAQTIGATAREIIFTSGATESNNFAIRGVAALAPPTRRHIVVSAIEHKSVIESAKHVQQEGWSVSVLPVRPDGRVDLDALASVVTEATALVSIMAANNEIGTLQALDDIVAIAHARGALVHTDAAQAAGKIPIDLAKTPIDLLSLTAHKIYGPKGCGALFVRKRTALSPLIFGGGHERGMRAGTLNVPGIVGLGAALALAKTEMPTESARLGALRDRLMNGFRAQIDIVVTGTLEHRLPNNLHVCFPGVDGESLLVGVSDIAVSSGSACSSATAAPSHVLAAIFGDTQVPSASIRFGLGRFTTDADIDYAIEKFTAVVRKLRATSPSTLSSH